MYTNTYSKYIVVPTSKYRTGNVKMDSTPT